MIKLPIIDKHMSELLRVDQTNLLYEANYEHLFYQWFIYFLSGCVFVKSSW